MRVDGVERLPRLIDEHGPELAARLELPVEVIRELRMIPSYYLRYYYAHDRSWPSCGGTARARRQSSASRPSCSSSTAIPRW